MTLVCHWVTSHAQVVPPKFHLFAAHDWGADSLHRADPHSFALLRMYWYTAGIRNQGWVLLPSMCMCIPDLLTNDRFPYLDYRPLACHLSCYDFSSSSITGWGRNWILSFMKAFFPLNVQFPAGVWIKVPNPFPSSFHPWPLSNTPPGTRDNCRGPSVLSLVSYLPL